MSQPEQAERKEFSSQESVASRVEELVNSELCLLNADSHIIEVTIIKPGAAKVKINSSQVVYTEEALKNSLPLWEGAACFCNHFNKSVRNIVGVFFSPWYDQGIKAKLRLIDDTLFRLINQIITDRAKGLSVPDIGISADIGIKGTPSEQGEEAQIIIEEITNVVSADIVFAPAAGGSFDRVLNALREKTGIPDQVGVVREQPLQKRVRDLQSAADKLRTQVKNQEEQLQGFHQNLKEAVDKYRQMLLSQNPDIPAEMIQGDTIAELDSSLERAKALAEVVRRHLEAQVPAGAPARTGFEVGSLSPIEKIKYGLKRR